MMTKAVFPSLILAVVAMLPGCTTMGTAPVAPSATAAPSATGGFSVPVAPAGASQRESISYSVGPCFGFCPVYTAAVSPTGKVSFEGKRHTTVLGTRDRDAGPAAYAQAAASLAPFRPTPGTTAKTTCDVESSDSSSYQITWTTADGRRTVLDHGLGCRSAANERLNAALRELPAILGIADWSTQITRTGASRG